MDPKEWEDLESVIKDLIKEQFPETWARMTRGRFHSLYAMDQTDRAAFFSVGYNHSTRPYFTTFIVAVGPGENRGKVLRVTSGHPRSNGCTKKDGWTIDPGYDGNW